MFGYYHTPKLHQHISSRFHVDQKLLRDVTLQFQSPLILIQVQYHDDNFHLNQWVLNQSNQRYHLILK